MDHILLIYMAVNLDLSHLDDSCQNLSLFSVIDIQSKLMELTSKITLTSEVLSIFQVLDPWIPSAQVF